MSLFLETKGRNKVPRKDYQERAERAYDQRSNDAGEIKLGIRIKAEHKPKFQELARKSRAGTLAPDDTQEGEA